MGGLKLGRLLGIPIQINYSFLLLMAVFFISQGLGGVALLLVTFLSVLLHELGHALVARRLKVPILGIDLHFFGGAAKMGRMPDSPREEILIAAAGPAVSFVLALLGFALLLLTRWSGFAYLGWVNLVLGTFNLLPALPMDGGRIFRALLSRRMGRLRATTLAVKVARGVALALGLLGLVRGNLFLVGLAVMLWLLAGAELRAAQLWHHMRQGVGGFGGLGNMAWPGFGASSEPSAQGGVEVLDREGRPVGRTQDPAADPGVAPGTGPGMTVEETRQGARRQWVIRDAHGRVLFMAEQPLRW